MSELLSIRAYARLRGVSHVAVLKAAREGRITLVDGQVDPEAADGQWAANTMPQPGRQAAEARPEGGHEGADQVPPGELLATREYLIACADVIARCVKGRKPPQVRQILRAWMQEIADELERAGLM